MSDLPKLGLAVVLTVTTIAAGIILPNALFVIYVLLMITVGSCVLAGYWYETSIRLESELIPYRVDNVELAHELHQTNTRLADVLGDELDLPLAIVEANPLPKPLRVVPIQRPAGGLS